MAHYSLHLSGSIPVGLLPFFFFCHPVTSPRLLLNLIHDFICRLTHLPSFSPLVWTLPGVFPGDLLILVLYCIRDSGFWVWGSQLGPLNSSCPPEQYLFFLYMHTA